MSLSQGLIAAFHEEQSPWYGGINKPSNKKNLLGSIDPNQEYLVYEFDTYGHPYNSDPMKIQGKYLMKSFAHFTHLYKVTTLDGTPVCRCSFVDAGVEKRVRKILH